MEAEPPKHKRRWFQFSLRTLLILTTIVAIPCAWLGRKIEQKRRERNAVRAIAEKFGLAQYDYEIAHQSEPSGPAWLRRLFGDNLFSEVTAVSLTGGSHDDDDLAVLDDLPNIHLLDLQDTNVTDAGLAHLSGLSELERLNLKGTPAVGNAGCRYLSGLGRLKWLDLSGTKTSELKYLKALGSLEYLDLLDTKTDDAGVNELRNALPNCTIYH